MTSLPFPGPTAAQPPAGDASDRPVVLDYGDPAATNDRVVGPIAGALAFVACWDVLMALRWPTIPCGAWLVAAPVLSPEALNAAKSAAAIMGMNNIYYRFLHLVEDGEYSTMPARLRMNIIANPGVDKVDFELWCTTVSAVNGCGMCLDSRLDTIGKLC